VLSAAAEAELAIVALCLDIGRHLAARGTDTTQDWNNPSRNGVRCAFSCLVFVVVSI